MTDAADGATPTGDYLDGRRAVVQRVKISIARAGLTLSGDAGAVFWPADGIELVDILDAGRRYRFAHREHGEARLIVSGRVALDRIRPEIPGAFERRRTALTADLRRFAVAGGVLLLLAGVIVSSLPALTSLAATLVPLSVERQLGDAALRTLGGIVDGADRRCAAPDGIAALEEMTRRLVDGRKLRVPIEVRVVPVGMVNAVALPGGHVLIFEKLLHKVDSAEAVAGILAHEIGHTQHRHGVERLIRDSALDALASIVAPGGLGELGAGLGRHLLSQSYGRDAEREADTYAVETLNRIDVATDGMAGFFRKMAGETDEDGALQYFASHPASAERAETIAAQGSGHGRILDDAGWVALRSICDVTEPMPNS